MISKVEIYDNRNDIWYDVSKTVSDMTITTELDGKAGTLKFTILALDTIAFYEGATVAVYGTNDTLIFKGYVFKKSRKGSNAREIDVTAYDMVKYLGYKDSFVFTEGQTIEERFNEVCEKHALPHKVIDTDSTALDKYISYEDTLYNAIEKGLEQVFDQTRKRLMIRDNNGTLELANVLSYYTPYILGDNSYVTDFSYASDIDSQTYNYIKVINTGDDDTVTASYEFTDPSTVKQWGLLSDVVTLNTNDPDYIEKYGKAYLNVHNTVNRTLKIEALGIEDFHAGTVFRVRISDLGDFKYDALVVVNKCQHKYKGDQHTMTLDCEMATDDSGQILYKGETTGEEE